MSFEDYEIVDVLGDGGFGVVYKARRADGVEVALKMVRGKLLPETEQKARFRREIQVQKDLSHPNVVRTLDEGDYNGSPFFVMELCSGGNLNDRLRSSEPPGLDPQEAVALVTHALSGLHEIHQHGYVHRDIKLKNLLLDGSGVVKVADFGLAKALSNAGVPIITRTGDPALGSPPFMAREQLQNFKYATGAVDIWSMGAVLYALLTRRPPRNFSEGRKAADVILHEPVVPIEQRRSGLPPRLVSAVMRALDEDPKRRFDTAAAFATELC
jgi:serine/threonine protein kinase